MNATAGLPVVGVDLAKSVFQLAVADSSWRVIEQHRLTRSQFERWLRCLSPGRTSNADPDGGWSRRRRDHDCHAS